MYSIVNKKNVSISSWSIYGIQEQLSSLRNQVLPFFSNFIDNCELMYSTFDEKNKEYLSKMTKYNTGTCKCKKIKC